MNSQDNLTNDEMDAAILTQDEFSTNQIYA